MGDALGRGNSTTASKLHSLKSALFVSQQTRAGTPGQGFKRNSDYRQLRPQASRFNPLMLESAAASLE